MTETFERTINNTIDHTKFGGIISFSDFNTNYPRLENNNNGSYVASKIKADKRFDEQCRKRKENNERQKHYGK